MNISSLKIGIFDAVTTEDLKKLEAQYTFMLSNDSAMVPTDLDGSNGDYTIATTQPIIYKLGVLDTSNWNITVSPSTGITGAFFNGEYKVTNMTTDTGKVTFTAKNSQLTLTKVFNITKAKAGKTGESSYNVVVLSSRGNTFKNGEIETTLKAFVYYGNRDITEELDANRFKWTRVSNDSASDIDWNAKNFSGKKQITITPDDVYKRTMFQCDILGE